MKDHKDNFENKPGIDLSTPPRMKSDILVK